MLQEAESIETELAAGTLLLRGQYDIDRPLGVGGFGITYLAHDSLNRRVVIKECYPQDHCKRRGKHVTASSDACAPKFKCILEQFKREAFRLAALDHPRVVGVHQVFEENGTAFLSMDHIDCGDLFTIAEDQPNRLDPNTLRQLLFEALDAIEYVHEQGLLHRDLAPDNFILGVDSHLTLIDFGSACEIIIQPEDENAKVLAVKEGYSPYEFYTNDVQDASSDLYSLAATFHYLIAGCSPPDSQIRMTEVRAGQPDPFVPLLAEDWGVDRALTALINQGLSLDRKARLRTAADWVERLGDAQIETAPTMDALDVAAPEPICTDEISRLVQSTNSALAPGLPNALKKHTLVADDQSKDQDKPTKPKQHFDIFGNPIHDVEAFLREQDAKAKKQPRAKSKAQPHAQNEGPVSDEQNSFAPSALGRILDKVRPGKRSLTSAIPQN